MSADSTAAAYNNLVKFAQQMRGIMAFADELKDYASFKQSREDEEKAVAAARDTLASLTDNIAKTQKTIAALTAQVEFVQHEMELDRAHGEDMRNAAKSDAAEIVGKAQAEALIMKADAQKAIDGRKAERDDLAAQVESLTAAIDAKQNDLANISLKVQALQERHEKMATALDAAKGM